MGDDRWSFASQPSVLGAVVHGPAVVARSSGIAMAVRCIFARPDNLEIDLVLHATAVQAEAAGRQSFGVPVPQARPGQETADAWRGGSEPAVLVEIEGRRAAVYPTEQTSSGGEDQFDSELRVVIPELPADGLITLTVSWPQAGLAEGSVTLTLGSLDNLEQRIVRLLP